MYLATEYMIRSLSAVEAFVMPCSIFITRQDGSHTKMVVSLQEHSFSKQILVKQWDLSKANKDEILPPFEEHVVDREYIFKSPMVVIPKYKLLPFVESPYQAGTQQRSTGAVAEQQEKEYCRTFDKFFFPEQHVGQRTRWLWTAFLESHQVPVRGNANYLSTYITHQMELTAARFKTTWAKWRNWVKHLDQSSEDIAPELVFAEAYRLKDAKEQSEKKVKKKKKGSKVLYSRYSKSLPNTMQDYFSWTAEGRDFYISTASGTFSSLGVMSDTSWASAMTDITRPRYTYHLTLGDDEFF